MTQDKRIIITMAGSGGKSKETSVAPGDRPRDVLARLVEEEPDRYDLRSGTGKAYDPESNIFEEVDDGDVLYGAVTPVVGAAL